MSPVISIVDVEFPKTANRNVNMMPFVLGEWSTLPKEFHDYIPMIEKCRADFKGQVCYLTVSESDVKKGESQRRPGAHTEASRKGRWGGGAWGGSGYQPGVFMASNIADTTRVWPDKEIPVEQLGPLGSLLEDPGPDYYNLAANELVGMSDRVPHEGLPQQQDGHRQFFRLVGPEVHGWYKQHSTSNPLCAIPASIPVIERNKFDK